VSKIVSKASSKNFVDPLNNCLFKLLKTSRFVIIYSFLSKLIRSAPVAQPMTYISKPPSFFKREETLNNERKK
jgi:hypothetical protein